MINLNMLNKYRVKLDHYGWLGNGVGGAFEFHSIDDYKCLRAIASATGNWDHVSVSREDRIPTWNEMEQIAKMFFKPNETAYQLHLPANEHINCHPNVLHWWRPQRLHIPRPPKEFV